jgi:hypothetical protein
MQVEYSELLTGMLARWDGSYNACKNSGQWQYMQQHWWPTDWPPGTKTFNDVLMSAQAK